LVEPDKLRFTIEARVEKAQELIGIGMSQRAAAQVLGVSKDTVRRALAHVAPNSGAECATPPRTPRARKTLPAPPPLPPAPPQVADFDSDQLDELLNERLKLPTSGGFHEGAIGYGLPKQAFGLRSLLLRLSRRRNRAISVTSKWKTEETQTKCQLSADLT
jgi:hypothetical protein